jgi:hypothetical protein
MTSLTRPNINRLIEDGHLIATKTEGGQTRIMIETLPELEELIKRIEGLEQMIKQLCKHLGVKPE